MTQQKPVRLSHTLFTLLLAAAMMALVYALLGIAPFGDNTVLTGDLNAQYIPYFAHYKRAFAGDAGFWYGMDKSLGGALAGLFAYYVASPLNLLYLLVPVSAFPLLAGLLLGVKIVLACGTFQVYIARKFPALGWKSGLLGLCYGFCAYSFVYAQNVMWHDVVVLLPLVCLGIDRIVAGRSPVPYILFLALAIYANFYIAYMACLFAVLYFAASLVLAGGARRALLAPVAKFCAGSLGAGGLCGFLLLPALYNVNASKGELLGYSFSLETNFSLLRLPQKLFWGAFSLAGGDTEGGLPLVYCGLIVVLLALCFFLSGKVAVREKCTMGALLLVLAASFWVGGLDELWHGMAKAVWFPFRNAFLFCFVLVLVAGMALARGAAQGKALLVSGGLLGALLCVYLAFPGGMGRGKLLLNLALLALALLLLWYLAAGRRFSVRRGFAGALCGVVALELALNGMYITGQFELYTQSGFGSFLENQGGSVAAIQGWDEGPYPYRMEKNGYRTLNDPMLLGYSGLSHFGSTQDNASTDALYALGYRGYASYLYGSTAFADSVLGLRYLVQESERPLPAHWEAMDEQAPDTPLSAYENPYVLPLFFTVENEWERTDADAADSFGYQNALYAALGGAGALLEDVTNGAALFAQSGERVSYEGVVNPGDAFRLETPGAGWYYALAAPAGGYLYDCTSLVDGEAAGGYFTADHTGVINLGYYEEGEWLALGWDNEAPLSLEGIWFAYIQPERMAALAEQAGQHSGDFTLADGLAEGSITAAAGRTTLFTSLPHDENWRATVNGTEVRPQRFGGAFLSLELSPGENEVRLWYEPRGLSAGVGLTLVAAAALAAWGAVALVRWKRNKGEN